MQTEQAQHDSGKVFQKAKRGRPRLMEPESEKMQRSIFGPEQTHRSFHNFHYCVRALGTLRPKETPARWSWLFGAKGDNFRLRQTTVAQLGRTRNPEAMAVFADRLCQLKPRTADAVKMLRGWEDSWQSIAAVSIVRGVEVDAAPIARKVCGWGG